MLCLKTKTPSCIPKKRNWKFAFAFEYLGLDFELLNLLFPLKLHRTTLERQICYLKCFATIPLWQSNNLVIILCHQSLMLHCLSLIYWKLLFGEFFFFFYDFKNIEHLITLVNSNVALIESLSLIVLL